MKTIQHRMNQPNSDRVARIFVTVVICAALIGLGWAFRNNPVETVAKAATTPTPNAPSAPAVAVNLTEYTPAQVDTGITRQAQIHTNFPKNSGFEVTQYTVKEGDTIFEIAQQFGLNPSTLLWGNLNNLGDNPEMIYPGQDLNILPVDGIYYEWHQDDGLNRVAEVFQVEPEDIVDFPGNHLDANALGDYAHPNINPGTWIVVPGGYRNFITWSAPTISRFNPGSARLYGPGACTEPSDGAVGTGSFTWPTVEHWLSGYDYAPEANHSAVDVAGSMGNAIYAADNGVVVYAGWNDHGYGNVTVIDHGNGYQTLYGHQSEIRVVCGQSVFKGGLIGNMGSTGRSSGPHLHFEMWDNGVHINPHNYIPFESLK